MSKNTKDPLGDRCKEIENRFRVYLPKKSIICIRADGKSFHTVTRKLARPYDSAMSNYMESTMLHLCESIQGCKVAYTQSDEITLLLSDLDKPDSEHWFGGNLQKIVSVSASIATEHFNQVIKE